MFTTRNGSKFFTPRGKVTRSNRYTDDSVYLYLRGLDCPRALTVWLLYKYEEHDQLIALGCRPEWFGDSESFRTAYAASMFLRKADFLKLSVDPSLETFKSFYEQEQSNAVTNRRFRNLALDPLFKGPNVSLFNAMTRKIASCLGDFPLDDPEYWFAACRWGPGSTTEIRGADVSSANKYQLAVGITSKLHQLLQSYPELSPIWESHISLSGGYELQETEELTLVPKDAKSRRTISIPVSMNSYYQLGIGRMMRRCIYRYFGIDLNSQLRNQSAALYGAVHGTIATVDFSQASNSVCYNMVRESLPQSWFDVMDACRVSRCRVADQNLSLLWRTVTKQDNTVHNYELFTAMGCGFTFELETLIFAAAAHAVCEHLGLDASLVSVFGDDVILPSEAVPTYQSFCEFLGFRFNPEKSFSQGMFRESCGSHYFGRCDVKPIYLRRRLRHVTEVYTLCNNIRQWSHRNLYYGCDPRLYIAWHFLRSSIPRHLKLLIPSGYGDVGVVSEFEEALPSLKRAPFGREGYAVRCMTSVPLAFEHFGVGLLLSRLHDVEHASDVSPTGNRPSISNSTFGRPVRAKFRVTWIKYVPQWCSYGPWLLAED